MTRKKNPDERPPAFQCYARDVLSDDNVIAMSNEELGIYFRLLLIAWLQDRPGYLRNDPVWLAKLSKLSSPEDWARVAPGVLAAFDEVKGFLRQKRMVREREKQIEYRKNKQAAGKASGEARRAKKNAEETDSKPAESISNTNEQKANRGRTEANGPPNEQATETNSASASASSSASAVSSASSPIGEEAKETHIARTHARSHAPPAVPAAPPDAPGRTAAPPAPPPPRSLSIAEARAIWKRATTTATSAGYPLAEEKPLAEAVRLIAELAYAEQMPGSPSQLLEQAVLAFTGEVSKWDKPCVLCPAKFVERFAHVKTAMVARHALRKGDLEPRGPPAPSSSAKAAESPPVVWGPKPDLAAEDEQVRESARLLRKYGGHRDDGETNGTCET